MLRLVRSRAAGAALLACLGGLTQACYVEDEEAPAVYDADDYEPVYYDGYFVYYDDLGRPYYYTNGAAVWIGPESPYYGFYVNHWRLYGPAYRHWYARYGWRYRGSYYRGYDGYRGGYRGGRRR